LYGNISLQTQVIHVSDFIINLLYGIPQNIPIIQNEDVTKIIEIGKGGFGNIWLCEYRRITPDKTFKHQVALKIASEDTR